MFSSLRTVLTLSLGGATFIAVLSVDRSFNLTVENYIEGQYGLDAALFFKREQRVSWLLPFLQSVSGVVRAESWYYLQVPMKLADGQQVQVLLQAGPDDTQLYHPILKSGC